VVGNGTNDQDDRHSAPVVAGRHFRLGTSGTTQEAGARRRKAPTGEAQYDREKHQFKDKERSQKQNQPQR
jgi:hypothetical protein